MADRDLCCETALVHEDSVKKVRADMLPEADIAAISEIFKIIGDPTRARIVWALDRYELCVCDLARRARHDEIRHFSPAQHA